ncbi:MAG TPA: DUF1269 domain-containing protein [Anaerolineae bacterium]|nr:DUF1269 domain-containing protein [Anaerolineae bacterium]
MSELIVIAFDNETGAEGMRDDLQKLKKEHLISLKDAAVVVHRQDGKVKVKQITHLVGKGALVGGLGGLLLGTLFLAPWLGLVGGAIGGAVAGKETDIGVDDDFIKEVGKTIEPGHSALFLLIDENAADMLIAEIHKFDGTVLQTSLSEEDEVKFQAALNADVQSE